MDRLQVVAQPHRREILRLVWDRERSAGEIARHFELTFGAVSQHLGVLRGAGFVRVRRAGSHRLYRADPDALGELRSALESLWGETPEWEAATMAAARDGSVSGCSEW